MLKLKRSTSLTWIFHASRQLFDGIVREHLYLGAVAHAPIGRQMPETGLALPSAGHLLGSLLEAGTEA